MITPNWRHHSDKQPKYKKHVRRAAEYLVLYMDVRLKPYKVNEKLNEFDKDGGFLF